MNPVDQERADAANDAYANRSRRDIEKKKEVNLDGQRYQVFGYANDPITGFHATAYKSLAKPYNIIIAYRGTDPGLFSGETKAEKAGHALTTFQDIAVDATMVRDAVNPQKAAADAFTAQMLAKAAKQGIPKNHITVAGHSLGGALAQIEAAKYGLSGSTYNAYGASDLIDGPPQPGCHLTNYRMAGDVVSAASPHLGEVVSLASQDDIHSLRAGRYLDAPACAPPPNALLAMRLDDHGGQQHFHSKSPDNVLQPQRFQQAAQRYAQHQAVIERFGRDVSAARADLALSLRQMHTHSGPGTLSPQVRRQVNEVLALQAAPFIGDALERNAVVQGAEHRLQSGADFAHASGRAVQDLDTRMAAGFVAGPPAAAVLPAGPLSGAAVGVAAYLHGQAAEGVGRLAGDALHGAKDAVERGAHNAAEAVLGMVHSADVQAGVANSVNRIVGTYDATRDAAQAAEQTYHATGDAIARTIAHAEQSVTQTYDAARHAVSHGLGAAAHAADRVEDTLAHPGQWFQHGASAASTHAGSTQQSSSVDMQEQARIAQLQQQEQHAQAVREQQQHLAQQHAQLHRQAMEAQQREHAQRHRQNPWSHPHEQPQAAEPLLYTPPVRPPRSDAHLQDFRQPDHPMHSRYTQFKNALEQSHTLPRHGDKLPYGPAQQERLAAGFTDALGIDPHYEHSIKGFKQHEGQLLAYDHPGLIYEKSKVLRIDPEQALAKSPEQHAASWKAREASHPEPPSRVIAPVAITAQDMRHPAHPRHAMFEQARSAIANANEWWGRPAPDPEQLDRHAAHVVVESRKFGQTDVERVHLGMPQGHATQTPNYAVQSEGRIVAHLFAPDLAQVPDVAQASQRLQTVEQQNLAEQQAMQAQRAAQMQGQGMVALV
ncbi:XVIPCD domain-containing protein [Xanthomonas axonopodis pv. vasculorum]|uniref:XVIPCD domain-containing protein n=1 Tax=Xanthomonas axonopodis TaxID=53413 RepID=UPI003D77B48D